MKLIEEKISCNKCKIIADDFYGWMPVMAKTNYIFCNKCGNDLKLSERIEAFAEEVILDFIQPERLSEKTSKEDAIV